MKRRRTWRFAMWTGLAGSVLSAGLFVVGGWYSFGRVSYTSSAMRDFSLYGGVVTGQIRSRSPESLAWLKSRCPSGWWLRSQPREWSALQSLREFPGIMMSGGDFCLVLPSWTLLLFFAEVGGLGWWMTRPRLLPGHCPRCGYNLTGNTSGVCSECGERIARTCPAPGS